MVEHNGGEGCGGRLLAAQQQNGACCLQERLSGPPRLLRIGFLWHCVYPWDVRLEKIMKACADRGHEICLVCKGKPGLRVREEIDGLRVHRVLLGSGHPGRVYSALMYPLFCNPVWIQKALSVFRAEKVDLVIVRDLPLALLAGVLGKLLHKPVVLDMAENYPAALMVYNNPVYRPFLFANGWLPKKFEQLSLKTIDHVLVVTEEQGERLQRAGVGSTRITMVGNTPESGFYQRDGGRQGSAGDDRIEMLFVGFLDAHRGVELVVRAMPKLVAEFPNLHLTLVGDGTQRTRLIELSRSLGLAGKVELPGWVDFSQVPEFIRRSTICLIPHLRSEHTETTLPNKLFDYMAYSKPVVATDCAPIRRIIDEAACGVTFQSGSEADFVHVVRNLLLDPDRAAKGERGKRAVEQKYNWEVDKKILVQTLEAVAGSAR